nr:hypothetical protein [Tanacetum cinerariifolium]
MPPATSPPAAGHQPPSPPSPENFSGELFRRTPKTFLITRSIRSSMPLATTRHPPPSSPLWQPPANLKNVPYHPIYSIPYATRHHAPPTTSVPTLAAAATASNTITTSSPPSTPQLPPATTKGAWV